MPYTSDSVTSGFDEYPRFLLETLVDNGGDCEDTSILFSTLTLIMGYGTVYINPPDHCAVGVLGDKLEGSYYTFKDKTYYYCETTGDGWEIGEIPPEFKDKEVYIYEIREYQQYDPETTSAPSDVTDSSGLNTPILMLVAVVIVIVVATAIVLAASTRKGKHQAPAKSPVPEPRVVSEQTNPLIEDHRFCRYCGSNNKTDAVFCEKCGQNIE